LLVHLSTTGSFFISSFLLLLLLDDCVVVCVGFDGCEVDVFSFSDEVVFCFTFSFVVELLFDGLLFTLEDEDVVVFVSCLSSTISGFLLIVSFSLFSSTVVLLISFTVSFSISLLTIFSLSVL